MLWGECWAELMLEALDQPYYDPHPAQEEVEVKNGLEGLLSDLGKG